MRKVFRRNRNMRPKRELEPFLLKREKLLPIIQKAKRGNNSAYNIILEVFWNPIFSYVQTMVRQEDDAEDITIQTFTKAFEKLKLYKEDFDFKTWLLSIAHNTAIDFLRENFRRQQLWDNHIGKDKLEDTSPSPEELFINKQGKERLKKMIRSLKPKYRKVLELRYLEEKKYTEIETELGISSSNVKVTIMRAKKLLLEQIEIHKYF